MRSVQSNVIFVCVPINMCTFEFFFITKLLLMKYDIQYKITFIIIGYYICTDTMIYGRGIYKIPL